jgi:hypothetical protein
MSSIPRSPFDRLAGTYNSALALPPLQPSLLRKAGTDEYFVIPEVTGNEGGYEVGILSNKPAPAGHERWDEVFERYSTSDAQSAGTERVSPDAMDWSHRRKAIGSYKSAMSQGQE